MKIELIATDIGFTTHSIIYKVEFPEGLNGKGVVFCSNDIKDKDLILKPTFIDKDNMEVIFAPVNVISHFYQSILDGSIRNINEYTVEKNNIYNIGDVVGFILV